MRLYRVRDKNNQTYVVFASNSMEARRQVAELIKIRAAGDPGQMPTETDIASFAVVGGGELNEPIAPDDIKENDVYISRTGQATPLATNEQVKNFVGTIKNTRGYANNFNDQDISAFDIGFFGADPVNLPGKGDFTAGQLAQGSPSSEQTLTRLEDLPLGTIRPSYFEGLRRGLGPTGESYGPLFTAGPYGQYLREQERPTFDLFRGLGTQAQLRDIFGAQGMDVSNLGSPASTLGGLPLGSFEDFVSALTERGLSPSQAAAELVNSFRGISPEQIPYSGVLNQRYLSPGNVSAAIDPTALLQLAGRSKYSPLISRYMVPQTEDLFTEYTIETERARREGRSVPNFFEFAGSRYFGLTPEQREIRAAGPIDRAMGAPTGEYPRLRTDDGFIDTTEFPEHVITTPPVQAVPPPVGARPPVPPTPVPPSRQGPGEDPDSGEFDWFPPDQRPQPPIARPDPGEFDVPSPRPGTTEPEGRDPSEFPDWMPPDQLPVPPRGSDPGEFDILPPRPGSPVPPGGPDFSEFPEWLRNQNPEMFRGTYGQGNTPSRIIYRPNEPSSFSWPMFAGDRYTELPAWRREQMGLGEYPPGDIRRRNLPVDRSFLNEDPQMVDRNRDSGEDLYGQTAGGLAINLPRWPAQTMVPWTATPTELATISPGMYSPQAVDRRSDNDPFGIGRTNPFGFRDFVQRDRGLDPFRRQQTPPPIGSPGFSPETPPLPPVGSPGFRSAWQPAPPPPVGYPRPVPMPSPSPAYPPGVMPVPMPSPAYPPGFMPMPMPSPSTGPPQFELLQNTIEDEDQYPNWFS